MKKRIFSILLTLSLLLGIAILAPITTSAAVHGYGIWVGGVEINDTNAADVLEDGTVSYDATNKILTLNGVNITQYYTAGLGLDGSHAGIYSEMDGLTVNLVGENSIKTRHDPLDDMPDGCDIAILSTKNITVCGTGKLTVDAFSAVGSMRNVTVKDCELSCLWTAISAMGDITVDGAMLSAKMNLIGTESGDITLKNTTVTDGGQYMSIYTLTGDITIEDSDFTANCNVVEDESTCIMIGTFDGGGGNLTVKNSKLNLSSTMFSVFVKGKVLFENVSGSIEARGKSCYAIYADGDVEMSGCDLAIRARATDEAAGGICSASDVTITNSRLTMDIRAVEDYGVAIGFPEGEAGDVTASNSILNLSVTGPLAVGFISGNVKLTDCVTEIEATADPNGNGFGVGIYATGGKAVINGGVLDVTATGPLNGQPLSGGFIMTNELLLPELIDADVKLRGNVALCAAPDLTLYNRTYEIVVSTNLNGLDPVEYNKDNIASYQYFHIHGFYTVTYHANGGTGSMASSENQYGTYPLSENAFIAPEGKQFKGWSTTANGEVMEEKVIDVRQDVKFYAVWEDIPIGDPDPDQNPELDSNHTHSFGNEWKQSETEHYKECACGATQHRGTHIDSNANGSCDICGFVMTENEGGLGTGAIVGIACGSVAVVGIGGFALLWFVIKKKTFADLLAIFKK